VIHASRLDAGLDITRELLAKNQVLTADRSGERKITSFENADCAPGAPNAGAALELRKLRATCGSKVAALCLVSSWLMLT
jgi:hypothetical protein